MKPTLDLKDPKVKVGLQFFFGQVERALQVAHRFEDATFPIYWTLKTKPEQIGSGVLVNIKDQYFIFSASHIFDNIGDFQLLIGTGNKAKLLSLSGERFSTAKGPSDTHVDDPIDASVFHIQESIPAVLEAAALSLDDLDLSQPDDEHPVCFAIGFRSGKSKTLVDQAYAHRECMPSGEYGDIEYELLNIDKNIHLALAYDGQILMGDRWKKSPKPQGMSGGAMVRVLGVSLLPSMPSKKLKPLLSAITIAYRKEKLGKPGALIGTRVSVHLMAIKKYIPDLLDDASIQEGYGRTFNR